MHKHKKAGEIFLAEKGGKNPGWACHVVNIFYFAYSLLFAWVLFASIFLNKIYPNSKALPTFLLMLVFCAFFIAAKKFLQTKEGFLQKYGNVLCVCAVLFTGTVQLINGFEMRYTPAYDMEAIFGAGIAFAQQGSILNSQHYLQYFHMFPSNLGGAFFLGCAFSVARLFAIQDYFAVALVLNVVILQSSLFLCFCILRRVFGQASAALGLLGFLVFAPFYMMGPVFYTDSLSMVFPVLGIYIYLIAKNRQKMVEKCLLYSLAGFVFGFGGLVKFTVAIALLALVFFGIFGYLTQNKKQFNVREKWRYFAHNLLLPTGLALASFALVFALFGIFVRAKNLDKARLEKEAMPLSHWLAMGLIGNGGYDEADYDRAMKLPSRTARDEANRELIKTRLSQPGLVNLAKLFTRKAIRCFGDGSYDLAIFLDDNPHKNAAVHQFVLPGGTYHSFYRYFSQGVYFALFALGLAAAAKAAFAPKKNGTVFNFFVPWLCFFGLFLFLMMWETNSRYTLNYLPILLMCACAFSLPKKHGMAR